MEACTEQQNESLEELMVDTTHSFTTSPTSSNSGGISDDFSNGMIPVPGSLIGAENYLTITEGCKYALTVPQLTEAVIQCKNLVLDTAECSEERKWLVRRLIELRYKLVQAKEAEEEAEKGLQNNTDTKVILGHHLTLRFEPTSTTKQYCDRCCGAIWNVLQSWYQCSDCQYRCHEKCVEQTCRICSHLRISETSMYEARICPEVGLGIQYYKCAECKAHISYSHIPFRELHAGGQRVKKKKKKKHKRKHENSWVEPRLCDYNGLYYCASCHWNNSAIIPARVVRNWDFAPRLVCRASYQLLRLTRNRPLLTVNSKLYGFVKELGEVKKLRRDLLLMKAYLVRCREALEQKLLWKQFADRPHFMTESEAFSLRDLIELNSGKLLPQLESSANIFIKHIKEDCKICSGQGYYCELCDDKDNEKTMPAIFPFDKIVFICPKCSVVYHKYCWTVKQECSRCKRMEKRNEELSEKMDELTVWS